MIAFDQDEDAIQNKTEDKRLVLLHNNFRYLKKFLRYYNAIPADGIIADLGVSSHQFDQAERGFSTRFDSLLDMRMDRRKELSALQIINQFEEEKLSEIFKQYGEIDNHKKLTRIILEKREKGNIKRIDEFK